MKASLYAYLGKVKDSRNKSGLRHPLQSFLTMATLGIMSGFCALQELAEFFKSNEDKFVEMFGLEHGVASYTQIRTIFMEMDYDSLQSVFEMWALQYIDLTPSDWLSVDGKGLSSTVSDYSTSKQNFVAMINVFVERLGLVLTQERYESGSGKENEIPVAQRKLAEVLNQLEVKGLIIKASSETQLKDASQLNDISH